MRGLQAEVTSSPLSCLHAQRQVVWTSAGLAGVLWQRITLRDASTLAWPGDVGLLTPFPTVTASKAVMCFRTWPLGVLHC